MGGIASGEDAADFLAAGAACVAVGTESFRDPGVGRRIARELTELRRSPEPALARMEHGRSPSG
jgi:dihydroorotate dehydrogenase (NAD+) catalytic subunit